MATATITHLKVATTKPLRIHGTIARDLGIGIVSGVYPPGHMFDAEVVAGKKLNVSRTAYREALRILAAKGLVESRPKAGTRVSDPGNWNLLDPDILAWIFENYPRDELVEMLFEVRSIVEPRIASLAATRRTSEQLERMRGAVAAMEEHGLTCEQGFFAGKEFHSALVEASGNLFLRSLASGIIAAVTWMMVYKARQQRLSRNAVPDHKTVFEAVAAQDPFAAHAAMKRLIALALKDTLPHSAGLDGHVVA